MPHQVPQDLRFVQRAGQRRPRLLQPVQAELPPFGQRAQRVVPQAGPQMAHDAPRHPQQLGARRPGTWGHHLHRPQQRPVAPPQQPHHQPRGARIPSLDGLGPLAEELARHPGIATVQPIGVAHPEALQLRQVAAPHGRRERMERGAAALQVGVPGGHRHGGVQRGVAQRHHHLGEPQRMQVRRGRPRPGLGGGHGIHGLQGRLLRVNGGVAGRIRDGGEDGDHCDR